MQRSSIYLLKLVDTRLKGLPCSHFHSSTCHFGIEHYTHNGRLHSGLDVRKGQSNE